MSIRVVNSKYRLKDAVPWLGFFDFAGNIPGERFVVSTKLLQLVSIFGTGALIPCPPTTE